MASATDAMTTDISVAFKQSQRFVFYHIIVAFIGLFSVVLVGIEALTERGSEMHKLIQSLDFAICILLLMDFMGSLIAAPNRWYYFRTWGWLDLISSIPAVPIFRCGRIVRLVRVIRIIRAVKATRLVASTFLANKGENALLGMVLVTLILVVTCSATVLHFERLADGNISSADDALWWSVAAKLVNLYLKSRFVCGGHHNHPHVACLHPPIDSVMLTALAKANAGGFEEGWKRLQKQRWSKLHSHQYQTAINLIRSCMGNKPIWKIEEYWQGNQ